MVSLKDPRNRKRKSDSTTNDNNLQEQAREEANQNGRLPEEEDDDEEEEEDISQHKFGSDAMEVSIQLVRQKMDHFTQQVSGMLEAGKNFFMEAVVAFEERIVQLHQKQMEKWEEEIELIHTMDSLNEETKYRLAEARAAIEMIGAGKLQITST